MLSGVIPKSDLVMVASGISATTAVSSFLGSFLQFTIERAIPNTTGTTKRFLFNFIIRLFLNLHTVLKDVIVGFVSVYRILKVTNSGLIIDHK